MTGTDPARSITFTLNGTAHTASVPVRLSLADYLRDELGLTGTHLGCEEGQCGACTVLADVSPVRSCLMLAVQADGMVLTTIEGLDRSGEIADLQQALFQRGALQCGFCTAGMLIAGHAMLRDGVALDRAAVREELTGNICRCTGYHAIVDAVMAAGLARRGTGDD